MDGGAIISAEQDQRSFRDALSKFATGVTIITVATPDGPIGITVNSFASVSLEPRLVLWSLDKNSSRLPAFENAQHCAIHILRADQNEACMGFTKNAQAFDDLQVTTSDNGTPLIENCLARFECKAHQQHDAGDHIIFVSQVIDFETNQGNPMVFFDKSFKQLQD